MSEEQDKEYDVAISFVSPDLGLAQEIRDKLSSQLEVFLYTHRQQEITGRNGLATFRKVFREDSRLVVVLFQSRWGETPWTRVEHEAIKERCERARRAEEHSKFREETERLWHTTNGVSQVKEEVDTFTKEVVKLAAEASAAAPSLELESARSEREQVVGVRSKRASLLARLNGVYSNSLDKAYLRVLFFPHQIVLPGENRRLMGKEKIVEDRRHLPVRSRALGWCWEDSEGKHLSSTELADRLIRDLLDLLESRE